VSFERRVAGPIRLRHPQRGRHRQGHALGAAAVGIVHVLRSLLAEAGLVMAVDGYPTLGHLTPEALQRVM
jgi:hypothetical protein